MTAISPILQKAGGHLVFVAQIKGIVVLVLFFLFLSDLLATLVSFLVALVGDGRYRTGSSGGCSPSYMGRRVTGRDMVEC